MSAHLIPYAEQAASTLCLLIVAVACVAYLNDHVDRSTPACERLGYVFTAAGALGNAIYPWWPTIEYFPFGLILHVGLALIALSMLRDRLPALITHLPILKHVKRPRHETHT